MSGIRRVSQLGTTGESTYVDGSIQDVDIAASANIAQSKVATLTTDLAAKAPLASPTFTGTVIKNSQPCYTGDNTGGGQVFATADSDFIPVNTILTVGSAFNGSNGRFTVSQACKVLCLFNSLVYRAGNTSAHAWVEFRVNNVRKSVRNHLEYNVGGDYAPLSNSAVVSLNANDYVTCRIFTSSGGALYQDYYGGGLSFYILG